MARYADDSRAELAEKLHAVWPDAHQLGLSTRGDDDWGTHEWGATRYQLESIHRADGSVITRGGDDDMWELIEHRTGHSQDELRDLLDDIGEADAILGAAGPREHLVLGETLEFG